MNGNLILMIVLPVIFLVVGAWMIFSALRARQAAERAATWPSIAGVVTAAEMIEHRHRNSKTHTVSYTYEPKVEYSYTVLGTAYAGKKVSYGPQSYARGKAEQIMARYPLGQQVSVFYNTENPADSVLDPAAPNTTVSTIFGILFCVVALALAVFFLVTSL
jgi:hypothetical protein